MIKFKIILPELFYAVSAAIVIFSCLELAWPGIVLAYFNLNWLLIFWLIVGIIMMIIRSDNYSKNS